MKEKKLRSIIELPLIVNRPYISDNIDKRMEHARVIYNQAMAEKKRCYKQMSQTKEWRNLEQIIREELKKAETESKNNEKKKKLSKSPRLQEAYERKNEIMNENGFTEFGIINTVAKYAKYYNKTIPSEVAAKTIAAPLWSAWQAFFFGKGESVYFKKQGTQNSLTSANKSGMRFIKHEDGTYTVLFTNQKAKAKPVEIMVKVPDNTYNKEMLSANIKQCRVVRRKEKTKYHYYVQLIVDRAPHIKEKDGIPVHPLGKGRVGIAIWRGILCAVSDDKILVRKITYDLEQYERKREELSRKIEHLRRVNNPDNFNEDGTIKHGLIDENGKRVRLTWHYSSNYKKLREEKRELERKERVNRTLLHNTIVYELMEMGNEFTVMDMSFLTKKPEFDEQEPNKISNAEYRKKKQRRKAIQDGSPAELLEKLSKKLMAAGCAAVEKQTIPENLYWYQHMKGVSDKALYKGGETVTIDGVKINQTLYRAFLVRRFNQNVEKLYDQASLAEDWEKLKKIL